jgi:hypothetical protein
MHAQIARSATVIKAPMEIPTVAPTGSDIPLPLLLKFTPSADGAFVCDVAAPGLLSTLVMELLTIADIVVELVVGLRLEAALAVDVFVKGFVVDVFVDVGVDDPPEEGCWFPVGQCGNENRHGSVEQHPA